MTDPAGGIEIVFLDIGGVMYDDSVYARSWSRALRECGASFSDAEFEAEYAAIRAAQSGSFRRRLTARFLGPDADVGIVEERARRSWAYPPEALFDDVLPTLGSLAGGYRLGILANQPSGVREALVRDGVDPFIEIWGVSGDLGYEKPDPRFYARVLYMAGVAPPRAVMVGDRLDYDIVPAKRLGMHTVWVLRGEAPDAPTPEQLAIPETSIAGLSGLPAALAGLASP